MTDQIPYNAASIRILSPLEASERFGFARASELARLHPETPHDFITRMVEACQLSGWPVELAERRYLAGDKGITPSVEFVECHKALVAERRLAERRCVGVIHSRPGQVCATHSDAQRAVPCRAVS